MTAAEKLKLIKAFSEQPNKLLDRQPITEKQALMYPVFEQALYALINVLKSSDKWVKENEDLPEKDFYGYGNNVIAFCAPRGQGKTSAMLSLTHALSECGRASAAFCRRGDRCCEHPLTPKQEPADSAYPWAEIIDKRNYLVVPPIDPTVLDKHESVVGLILAWLFQEINSKWSKNDGLSAERFEREQLDVLKHFQKCKECLNRHSNTKAEDFSDLIKSSIVLEVKAHFNAILECYFRLCGQPNKTNYLIIQLDDTDMDMVNAYDVLEDVRKFLSVPSTVVMMATYLRQLRMLIARHYEETLGIPQNAAETSVAYTQMATKYIDKLIPAQQMIHINSFRHLRDLTGTLNLRAFQPDLKEEDEDVDVEKAFLEVIQERTGLFFLQHTSYVSNILPTTLRGLVHLYQLLDKMEPIPSLDDIGTISDTGIRDFMECLKIRQHNLFLFEDYFRNDWCYSNLDEKDQEIMWVISQAHTALKLQIIHNLLAKRWNTGKQKALIIRWKAGKQQGDNSNPLSMEAFSFLDIVQELEDAENSATDMNDLILNFAIRTHLSITLHKLYLSDLLLCLNQRVRENTVEQSLGTFVGIDFSQLRSFLKLRELDVKYDISCHELGDDLKQITEKVKQSERLNILYEVIFNQLLTDNQKTDVDMKSNYTLPEYNRTCFALQDSVFRVLGNHEILRLWLSMNPERFLRSLCYVTGGPEEGKRAGSDRSELSKKSYPISLDAQSPITFILDLLSNIRANLFHSEDEPISSKTGKPALADIPDAGTADPEKQKLVMDSDTEDSKEEKE